jgi:predicted amidohydrolase
VQAGADVLLTPELAMAGYPPEDLLLRPSFYRAAQAAFERLRQASLQWPGLTLVVGQAVERQGKRRNAATLVQAGVVIGEYWKRELPNYDVFDEERYFAAGDQALVVNVAGVAFGVLICEDFWKATAPAQTRAAGAQVILALNASPYHTEKQPLRLETARDYVCALGCPIVAANMVGGQDELVFDGGSFALDAAGVLCAQSPQFIQDVLLVDLAIHATAGVLPVPPTVRLPTLITGRDNLMGCLRNSSRSLQPSQYSPLANHRPRRDRAAKGPRASPESKRSHARALEPWFHMARLGA